MRAELDYSLEREEWMPNHPESKKEKAIIIAGPELSNTIFDKMVDIGRRALVARIAVEPAHIQRAHHALRDTKISVYALVSYPQGLTRAGIVRQILSWCKTQGASGALIGFPVGTLLSDEPQIVEELLNRIREEMEPGNVFLHCPIQGLDIQQVIKAGQFIVDHGYSNIQLPPEALASGWVDTIKTSVSGICLSIGPIREEIRNSHASSYWFDGSSIHHQDLDSLLKIED